jgi:ferritin-like metal-binding protein YciE
MKLRTLQDLFVDNLRDLYNAENQLIKALPKMAKASSSDELRSAFEEHLEQTKAHAERIERVFELLGLKAKGKTCKAMEGLIAEGKDLLDEDAEPSVLDAEIIAAAQRVEHYEMAGYGCVHTWARQLGHQDAAELLEQTFQEEEEADHKLTEIAESSINMAAARGM